MYKTHWNALLQVLYGQKRKHNLLLLNTTIALLYGKTMYFNFVYAIHVDVICSFPI